ncbi:MAG TPA: YceI family protein [Dinghuibacter sp.]|uniref:YceI family protein n=1 Tax=Dinghuibacter sp. TaxID=2024697 RepID=UPI002CC7D0F1|nr:YceI family protein [Dinghuibacter sp.]HTJ11709.1 YceI family protein [Dinghuibacter sp.]
MRILLLALYAATSWAIAPGYMVKWSTTGDAAGIFKGLAGNIEFDPANLATASFNVTIQTSTLNTGNGLMNTHAKSAEYLDVAKFPTISFTSNKVVKAGPGYQAIGSLTMHGVTKPLTMPFTFQQTGTGGTFHANFTVNRVQFGVGRSGDVDDNITIDLTVPVTKK